MYKTSNGQKKQLTDIILMIINNTNQPVKKTVLNDYFHFNRKPFTKTPDINCEQCKMVMINNIFVVQLLKS